MLDRAVVALKANEATALSEFNDKNNKQFHDRDLYVFCYNMSDGKFTAHPNPAMMGTDARTLKLKDDPFGQRVYDAIKGSSEGSVVTVDYSFPKPGTTEPVPKESFVSASAARVAASVTTNSERTERSPDCTTAAIQVALPRGWFTSGRKLSL